MRIIKVATLFLLVVVMMLGVFSYSEVLSPGYRAIISEEKAVSIAKPSTPPPVVNRVTIYYDNYGFDPNSLTVPLQTVVTVSNISTEGTLMFEALSGQPNQNSALDLGAIPQGSSKSFTVTKEGVWQYEGNHHPEVRGEIGTGPLSPNILSEDPGLSTSLPSYTTKGSLLIDYDTFGFMPNQVVVPLGTTITVENTSSNTQPGPMLFLEAPGQSDINSALNLGLIGKQQFKTVVLTKIGSWVFENAYQPAPKGRGLLTIF